MSADYMGSGSHHPKHPTAGLGKILRNHLGCQRDQLNLRTLAALGTGLGMHPLSSGPKVVCPHVSDQPQPSGDKGLGEYRFENQRGGLGILKPSQPNRRVPDRSGLTRFGSGIGDDDMFPSVPSRITLDPPHAGQASDREVRGYPGRNGHTSGRPASILSRWRGGRAGTISFLSPLRLARGTRAAHPIRRLFIGRWEDQSHRSVRRGKISSCLILVMRNEDSWRAVGP